MLTEVTLVSMVFRLRRLITDYPPTLRLLALVAFLNVGGLSFIWPLNAVYIHDVLGRPLTTAGVVLLLHSAGASLGQLTGGYLFDRLGARLVLLLGFVTSTLLICIPGFTENWPIYVAMMTLFGFTASLPFPAMNALAGKAWPEGGRRAFNLLYVATNLGVAVGTSVGGLLAQHSFRMAFRSAAASFALIVLVVYVAIHDGEKRFARQQSAPTGATSATGEPMPWMPIGALFAALLVLWMVYVQWSGPLAVYMQTLGLPLSAYSLLWTLNGLVIVFGQPITSLVIRFVREPVSQLYLGTLLFGAAFLTPLLSHDYSAFVAGIGFLSLGEMFISPMVPAMAMEISPPERRGFLQGFIGSAMTAGRMVGPLFGGVIYDHYSFGTLMAVALAMLSIPMISFALYARTRGALRMSPIHSTVKKSGKPC